MISTAGVSQCLAEKLLILELIIQSTGGFFKHTIFRRYLRPYPNVQRLHAIESAQEKVSESLDPLSMLRSVITLHP